MMNRIDRQILTVVAILKSCQKRCYRICMMNRIDRQILLILKSCQSYRENHL